MIDLLARPFLPLLSPSGKAAYHIARGKATTLDHFSMRMEHVIKAMLWASPLVLLSSGVGSGITAAISLLRFDLTSLNPHNRFLIDTGNPADFVANLAVALFNPAITPMQRYEGLIKQVAFGGVCGVALAALSLTGVCGIVIKEIKQHLYYIWDPKGAARQAYRKELRSSMLSVVKIAVPALMLGGAIVWKVRC